MLPSLPKVPFNTVFFVLTALLSSFCLFFRRESSAFKEFSSCVNCFLQGFEITKINSLLIHSNTNRESSIGMRGNSSHARRTIPASFIFRQRRKRFVTILKEQLYEFFTSSSRLFFRFEPTAQSKCCRASQHRCTPKY